MVITRKQSALWLVFSLCLVLLHSPAYGAIYYISSDGDDTNSGTRPDLPWRTLAKVNSYNFSPGDVVSFRCGSIWTGELLIHNSGTQSKPVTFTAYGAGDKPVIRNPGTWTSSIKINASYIVVEKFLLRDSHETGISILNVSNRNIVRDCEFTNMGAGVSIQGGFNLITRNYVHDMAMVVNDPGGDNDFGANGFMLQGPNNEISYNRGVNLIAPSFDYGKDGGFVEMYGNVDNSYIHHNWAQDSNGFFEVGGKPGSAKNVRISYNVSVNNNGSFGVLHISDQFGSAIDNFRAENNTIVDIKDYGNPSYAAIWFGGNPPPGGFIFRNNIVLLGRFSCFSSAPINRSNNLYHFLDGTTTYVKGDGNLGAGEIKADPKFANLPLNNFHLQPLSPAINKGMNLGYTMDYDNQPVPTGNAPDIGAYEYTGVVTPLLSPSPPNNVRINTYSNS